MSGNRRTNSHVNIINALHVLGLEHPPQNTHEIAEQAKEEKNAQKLLQSNQKQLQQAMWARAPKKAEPTPHHAIRRQGSSRKR